MSLQKCYYCLSFLDETNRSLEHIIPNSLGGQIASYKLLCLKCNNEFGGTLDRELYKQIGVFANMLDVKRDRPNHNIKIELKDKDGDIHYYGPNLKPYSKVYINLPGRQKLTLFSKNDEEAIKLIKKKEKELSNKNYTNYSYEKFSEDPRGKIGYYSNNLSKEIGYIGFGGKEFFQAMCKIAVNYSLYCGFKYDDVVDAIKFIKGDYSINNIARFYYPSHYIIHQLSNDEVSHILYLVGDARNKVLYCYIELFSTHNVIVIINGNYFGDEFRKVYCYNLIANQTIIDKELTIKLHRLHFLDLLAITDITFNDSMKKGYNSKLERLNKIIEARQLLNSNKIVQIHKSK